MFFIGLGVGVVWGIGACFASTMTGYTGPLWIQLLIWPAYLAHDEWRYRRARRAR